MGVEAFYEVSVAEGLEPIAATELRHRFSDQTRLFFPAERFPGIVQFAYGGNPHNLLTLKTVMSLFWIMRFQVPRPRALLGHQNLSALLERIDEVRAMWPKSTYKTFHLAAAGTETEVMRRIADEITRHTGLEGTHSEGDLLVRLRRPLDGSEGWEAGVRMSPRPLSTRPWRKCDWKGALNASVAQAMVQFTKPRSGDTFLNLACGSGTLLIERALNSPAHLMIGCDTNIEAINCAKINAVAAKQGRCIHLALWDARKLPLPDSCVDVICADLPFGHDVGSHQENTELYPALLNEAARVARPDARCLMLTHEIRLMESLLVTTTGWIIERIIPLTLTGLHPRIYILTKGNIR